MKDVKIKCYILQDNAGFKKDQTLEDLKSRYENGVFRIEVKNGIVQSIEEIYVP